MKRPLALGALALLAGIVQTACAPAVRPAPRNVEQDERSVLVALIRHLERESGERPVVAWMTEYPELDDLVPSVEAFQQLEDDESRPYLFPPEAFENLVIRSEEPAPVWSLLGDSTRARWLTPAQRDSLVAVIEAGGAPQALLRRMHGGALYYITFSRAGFDPSGRYAAIAYDTWCGDLCGSGGVVLLYRPYDQWKVLEKFPVLAASRGVSPGADVPSPAPERGEGADHEGR